MSQIPTTSSQPLSPYLTKITTHTITQPDIIRLMELGRHSGFKTIQNRKLIWPVLLELNIEKLNDSNWNKNEQQHSEDYEQLKKDAMRSFFSFSKGIDHEYIKKKQEDLLVILDAFAKNEPRYKYFQGFHDIVSIFIGIFGSNIAYFMSHRIATTYLRDSFIYTFSQTVQILDRLIYFIIIKTDPQFEQIFEQFEQQKLGFTMPWIITWFAHSFDEIEVITRIWDYLIASPASAVVYLSAALVLETKKQLVGYCHGMGFDLGTIHSFYQNLRSEKNVDIERVIARAIQLEDRIDIEKIDDTKTLPGETVMKEKNFEKLISAHQAYRKNKVSRGRRRKTVLLLVFLLGLWLFSVFGRRMSFIGDKGEQLL